MDILVPSLTLILIAFFFLWPRKKKVCVQCQQHSPRYRNGLCRECHQIALVKIKAAALKKINEKVK